MDAVRSDKRHHPVRPGRRGTARPAAQPGVGEGITTTAVGLGFTGEVTFEAWERAGRRIARVASASAWYLGDWLLYGQDRYTDRYRRVIDAVGLDYQTLRNYAWVARAFEHSRRRGGLSFQHHLEVAPLPAAEQDRWLDLAERERWSRNRLRKCLRESRAPSSGAGRSVLPRVNVAKEKVERWRQAAATVNADFEAWIVAELDRAAETALQVDDAGRATDPRQSSPR